MTERPAPYSTDAPTTASDGTDLTLIRCMLDLTPDERLRHLQDHTDSLEALLEENGLGLPGDSHGAR